MVVIGCVMTAGLSLVLLVFMGASIVFAKISWGCFKRYKDYLFVVCATGLFGTFLISFALLLRVISELFIGAAQ